MKDLLRILLLVFFCSSCYDEPAKFYSEIENTIESENALMSEGVCALVNIKNNITKPSSSHFANTYVIYNVFMDYSIYDNSSEQNIIGYDSFLDENRETQLRTRYDEFGREYKYETSVTLKLINYEESRSYAIKFNENSSSYSFDNPYFYINNLKVGFYSEHQNFQFEEKHECFKIYFISIVKNLYPVNPDSEVKSQKIAINLLSQSERAGLNLGEKKQLMQRRTQALASELKEVFSLENQDDLIWEYSFEKIKSLAQGKTHVDSKKLIPTLASVIDNKEVSEHIYQKINEYIKLNQDSF